MTAPIRSMTQLIDALRRRRDELNVSHETLDQISGLQSGYTSKLLAPKPIKNLGPVSMGSLLGALGVAIVVVEDPEAITAVQSRWQRKKRPQKLPASASRLSTVEEIQVTPDLQAQIERRERMKLLGKIGGKASAKSRMKRIGKRARQRIATHAARMRWSKRNGNHQQG